VDVPGLGVLVRSDLAGRPSRPCLDDATYDRRHFFEHGVGWMVG
jgi:hypothetical protein